MIGPGLSDQAARQRIATNFDANLCVEAAAGTGKTTVLVNRVVGLLAGGTVNVDQLVVITFTEKAAAELSTRVRDTLERRARAAEGEERRRLLRAARDLYRAHIETIHSFATALLRERPVEAAIDPLFEVLQGVAATLEFDRAYERFQDGLLSDSCPDIERALRRGIGLQELREACERLHAHRYLLPLDHPALRADDLQAVVKRLVEIASELRAMLIKHQPGDDTAVPFVEGILEWVATLSSLDPVGQERFVLWRPAAKTHTGAGSRANWGGEKERLKQLQGDYGEVLKAARVRLRTDALLGLLAHVERFVAGYETERRQNGRADFDDLLFWARDLLRDSAAARGYFRTRFRAVLIDEFQDTDPVQAELALLLTSDDEPGADWHALRPGAGRLTVVGDPKQSIYRFRRADIAIYDHVKTRSLAGGEAQISTNFRSNPSLLAGLNAAFGTILEPVPGAQSANVALQAPPDAPAAKRVPIVLAEGSLEGGAEAVRAGEARVIAGRLHGARRDDGRSATVTAHAEAGILYRHEGSRDFCQRDEVRGLIWVLSAIDDPTDRIALIGALRSSAFAISDEQLVIHAAAAGALSYRSPRPGPDDALNEALAELRALHLMRRSLSLAEVVRRVVERTRLVEFALTRKDGEQGAANLLAIVDDARLFAAAGGGRVRAFIRHLRDAIENEAIEIEATVAEETDDVVRIMTMHGAKGLEYPIVALANLGGQKSISREPVPREHESFLHFRVGADGTGRNGHFATPGYDDVWGTEKAYIEAERLPLLYVAATRARDYLLVPCVVGRHRAKHLLPRSSTPYPSMTTPW